MLPFQQLFSLCSRLLDIVSSYGKEYVVWQEVLDNAVKVRITLSCKISRSSTLTSIFSILGTTSFLSQCEFFSSVLSPLRSRN